MGILAPLLMAAASQASGGNAVVWHWDRHVSICVLRQSTSGGETIDISRTPGDASTGVNIRLPSQMKYRGASELRGAISLTPGGETPADVVQQADPDGQLSRISASTDDPNFMGKLAKASALEISAEGIQERIQLQSAAAAVDALQTCEDQKMKQWGIDSLALHSLRTQPKPLRPLYEYFTTNDYPDAALAYSVQGDAVLRLDVGADGRVTSCKALNPSKYHGFEYASCDLLRRARFKPATDASGQQVAAPYVLYVNFRMK